ncbi:MAG: hypothetical protein FJ035_06060 [Chloroflexi bacterium]|nr:hypothetical protein [Chloroflexota bacterium]
MAGYSGPQALYSASVIGWNAGFTAWLGIGLLVAPGVYLVLLRSEVALPALSVGPAVTVAGVAGLGLVLIIPRWLTLPRVGEGLARTSARSTGCTSRSSRRSWRSARR